MLPLLFILVAIYVSLYFLGLPIGWASTTFYIINSILFLVISVWYLLKYKRNNIICFELLFGISYWLCCFFAVFVIEEINHGIVSMQMLNFSEQMMCRTCSLSMLGYLLYMLGLCCWRQQIVNNKDFVINQNPMVNKLLNYATTFFIILFFLLGGYNFIYSYDQTMTFDVLGGERFGRFGVAMEYAILLLNVTTISNIFVINESEYHNGWKFIRKIDKHYMFNLLVMSMFLLICGYRSGAMQIFIPFFVALSLKRVIKYKGAILILAIGIALLALIGLFRSKTASASEINEEMSFALFFRDFLGANSATPSLMEYVDMYGSAHFRNAINQILAAIPYMQSIMLGILGPGYGAMSSSKLYTDEISRSFYSGMGTNIVGDLYYTGGFACVVICMFLLGCVVRKLSNSTNKYALIAFSCLVGNAVFMPRVEFFFIWRACFHSMILYLIVNIILPYRKGGVYKI